MLASIAPMTGTDLARRWLAAFLARLEGAASSHLTFVAGVVAAASLFWLSPRPPMVDLPQHAAQVALWRDLIVGNSAFADGFRVNLLTPYLIGYGLALPLSFLVSATTAVKLVLTGAFAAFVVSCRQLRREIGSDERLDWLFIPSFFGFAYVWGFYTFLVASPIVMQLVRFAWRHARSDGGVRHALPVVGIGVALLFSHGLAFLFAGLVGGMLVLAHAGSWRHLIRLGWPYAGLAVALMAMAVAARSADGSSNLSEFEWQADPSERLIMGLFYIQGMNEKVFLPFTLMMIAAPILMGLRFERRAAVPLAAAGLVLALVPHTVLSTDYCYERFVMFLLPFMAFAFLPPAGAEQGPKPRVGFVAMVAAVWASIVLHGAQALAFADENAHFERVLAAAEPGKRAARVVTDEMAPAPKLSLYQPSWYQADKQGLVEFNFARFAPQVVKYRGPVPDKGFAFDPRLLRFDWNAPMARSFDYYFVRQDGGRIPPAFLADPPCELRLVAGSGPWSLFARGSCLP